MSRMTFSDFAFIFILVFLAIAAISDTLSFDERYELQPVILTGDQLLSLSGVPISEIWAYRWQESTGTFHQVPLQIDERILLDLNEDEGDAVYELTYDWQGADDGLFDSDDEIVFMARDSGDRVTDTELWVAETDDQRIEIRLEDPLSETVQWLYLFTSSRIIDGNPSFSYVDYSPQDPQSGIADVESATYSIGYEGRWRLTRLEVKPGLDLLDRFKVRAYQISGGETEETFEMTSQMLGAYSGKVRAIREVMGAASGFFTTHLDFFYRDTWLRIFHLRVHHIQDIWYYYDYLPPSSPGYGYFYSQSLPAGLSLDGIDETILDTPVSSWSQVSLPEGTIVLYRKELTPFPPQEPPSDCWEEAGASFYWRDDSQFDDLTGDDCAAYGNHGIHLYCIEDTNTAPYSTSANHYFLPPQDPYESVGPFYAEVEENPLIASFEVQERNGLTDAYLFAMNREAEGRLSFNWEDALGEDCYEIYRGNLLTPFAYNYNTALGCDIPAQTTAWTTHNDEVTGQPSYFYVVVPRREMQRKYGQASDGSPRPPSGTPCP